MTTITDSTTALVLAMPEGFLDDVPTDLHATLANDLAAHVASGSKYDLDEVVENEEVFKDIARAYLEHYEGTFSFLVDVRDALAGGRPSLNQIRGILNCMVNDFRRAASSGKAASRVEPPLGVHVLDGTIFKVVKGKTSGMAFARALHVTPAAGSIKAKASWLYVGRRDEFWKLTKSTLITEAEAAAFGLVTGICAICGGIGPVCWSRIKSRFATPELDDEEADGRAVELDSTSPLEAEYEKMVAY